MHQGRRAHALLPVASPQQALSCADARTSRARAEQRQRCLYRFRFCIGPARGDSALAGRRLAHGATAWVGTSFMATLFFQDESAHSERGKAAGRLLRKNPRLDPLRQGPGAASPKPTADGLEGLRLPSEQHLCWSSRDNDAKFGRNIQAPCCVISGMLSHSVGGEMRGDTVDGRFAKTKRSRGLICLTTVSITGSKIQATWLLGRTRAFGQRLFDLFYREAFVNMNRERRDYDV